MHCAELFSPCGAETTSAAIIKTRSAGRLSGSKSRMSLLFVLCIWHLEEIDVLVVSVTAQWKRWTRVKTRPCASAPTKLRQPNTVVSRY